MTYAIESLVQRILKALTLTSLIAALTLTTFVSYANAAKTSMTGDYESDTVTVAKSLKQAIATPANDENRTEEQTETVALITDYISRYRNRPQINSRVSFTTMQTALNAMAGHYKTFSNRPLPENLKERLNKELSEAEQGVVRGN